METRSQRHGHLALTTSSTLMLPNIGLEGYRLIIISGSPLIVNSCRLFEARTVWISLNARFRLSYQPVDTTQVLNLSTGVLNSNA